jgi:OmpW family
LSRTTQLGSVRIVCVGPATSASRPLRVAPQFELELSGLPIGKSWLLPPTLTLQYHFTDFGAFKPYIGAGVN